MRKLSSRVRVSVSH